MMISQRVAYIDALRGFGILSVVYSHLIVMGLRGNSYHSPILPVINLYFMPLFFFLSGFLSGHMKNRITDFRSYFKEVWSKMKSLLFPTIVMFLLNRYYFDVDIWPGINDSYKGGYWFTYVLFAIIVIYAFIQLSVKNIKSQQMGGVIHILLALFFLFLSEHIKTTGEWIAITSADFILAYYIYYLIGSIAAEKREIFFKIIDKHLFSCVIFFLGFLPIFKSLPYYLTDLCRLSLVIVIFSIFRHYSHLLKGHKLFARILRLLGKNTLEIYFLQYFLLFRIDFVATLLKPLTNDLCFRGSSCYGLLELLLVGCISLLISISCIIVKKALQPFPTVAKLCFGKTT